VGIAKAHLVLEALGNADDHILDVGANGSDGGNVFTSTEPQVNLQLLAFIDFADINSKVLEGTLQGTLGALDSDFTGLDVDGDYNEIAKARKNK
jgi:hypothetical protein